jgi:transketolase
MTTAPLAALRDGFGQALVDLGATNQRLVVLDGDAAPSTKASMFALAYPDRFFQFGIAEQNMLSAAAGFASFGFVPVVSIFACFATKRALDQIRICIAQPILHVVIAAGFSGLLVGKNGKTHQSVQDISIMRSMPGMTVIAPADSEEAYWAVLAAVEHDGPVYVRLVRDPTPAVFESRRDFQIGRAMTVREGGDVALVTTGTMLPRAIEGAQLLESEGIHASILHVPTLKPLDEDAIVRAAAATSAVVTCEEHSIIGGLGSAVAETLSERWPTRVARVGLRDTYGASGPPEALLKKFGLTGEDIATTARHLLEARSR